MYIYTITYILYIENGIRSDVHWLQYDIPIQMEPTVGNVNTVDTNTIDIGIPTTQMKPTVGSVGFTVSSSQPFNFSTQQYSTYDLSIYKHSTDLCNSIYTPINTNTTTTTNNNIWLNVDPYMMGIGTYYILYIIPNIYILNTNIYIYNNKVNIISRFFFFF